jgi:hypothetical protein
VRGPGPLFVRPTRAAIRSGIEKRQVWPDLASWWKAGMSVVTRTGPGWEVSLHEFWDLAHIS